MPTGVGGLDDDSIAVVGLDANAISTTVSVVVGDNNLIAMYVAASAGSASNTTHQVTLQISPDGTTWFDTTHQITGVGDIHDITCVAVNARLKVTIVEGAASTIDIFILTK